MIWILIVLAVIVIGQSVLMFWNIGTSIKPTREELLEDHWFDFLNWASKPKNYAGLSGEYETNNKPGDNGSSIRVPIPNENNFWFWWLEYKHGDKVSELNKSRKG